MQNCSHYFTYYSTLTESNYDVVSLHFVYLFAKQDGA